MTSTIRELLYRTLSRAAEVLALLVALRLVTAIAGVLRWGR
jgi:hypothetical protein